MMKDLKIGTQRSVLVQCRFIQRQSFTIIKKKLLHLRALKAKQDLVKLQQQKECSAEAEKVSACNQQAKERFVSNDDILSSGCETSTQ